MHALRCPAAALRLSSSCPAPAFLFVHRASLAQSAINCLYHGQQRSRIDSTTIMTATDATLRAFFQSPKFAVVGASTNKEKFGYKGKCVMELRRWIWRAASPQQFELPT